MEAINSIDSIDTLKALDSIQYLKKETCKEVGRNKN